MSHRSVGHKQKRDDSVSQGLDEKKLTVDGLKYDVNPSKSKRVGESSNRILNKLDNIENVILLAQLSEKRIERIEKRKKKSKESETKLVDSSSSSMSVKTSVTPQAQSPPSDEIYRVTNKLLSENPPEETSKTSEVVVSESLQIKPSHEIPQSKRKLTPFLQQPKVLFVSDSVSKASNLRLVEKSSKCRIRSVTGDNQNKSIGEIVDHNLRNSGREDYDYDITNLDTSTQGTYQSNKTKVVESCKNMINIASKALTSYHNGTFTSL